MKLSEMAMTTGAIVAPPSFSRKEKEEDQNEDKKDNEGNEDGDKEEEQVCDSGEHAGARTIEKSVDPRDR